MAAHSLSVMKNLILSNKNAILLPAPLVKEIQNTLVRFIEIYRDKSNPCLVKQKPKIYIPCVSQIVTIYAFLYHVKDGIRQLCLNSCRKTPTILKTSNVKCYHFPAYPPAHHPAAILLT